MMINIHKVAEKFKTLTDGDIIEFIKENDDPVKLEIIHRKTDTYKFTYRGRSTVTNMPLNEFLFKNTIRIKVNGEDITSDVS